MQYDSYAIIIILTLVYVVLKMRLYMLVLEEIKNGGTETSKCQIWLQLHLIQLKLNTITTEAPRYKPTKY